MSAIDDALQKAMEAKEAQWAEQLGSLRTKLTQAGNHLKTLAQENASLNKKIAEQDALQKSLEREREEWQKKSKDDEKNVVHMKELMNLFEKTLMDGDDDASLTDIPADVSVDDYLKKAAKRLQDRKKLRKEKDKQSAELVEKLTQQVAQLTEELKSKDTGETRAKETESSHSCDSDTVQKSLANLANDLENGTVDTSLPLDVLRSMEDLRTRWLDQITALKKRAQSLESTQTDMRRQATQLQHTVNTLTEEKERLTSEKEELEAQVEQANESQALISQLRAELEASERTKRESEERVKTLQREHQSLLDKLAQIKETLAPRLEADRQLRQRVGELQTALEATERDLEQTRSDMMKRDESNSQLLSQKEQELESLHARFEHVQHEKEEWQAQAMQAEAQKSELEQQNQRLKLEGTALKRQLAEEKEAYELERASLANLQTVLEEFQASKDAEIKAAVEHIERQLDVAKRSWAEYQERARIAESTLEQYQQDVAKAQNYEREIKEKNLLIGKLRHEAIILNEHLIEAMRRLKEETSENNVDRLLITNLIVGFFMAPRGDRKRFEILTIIANVLQMNDEQKEQVGLIRSKSARTSPSIASSSSGWQSPHPQTQDDDTRESFTDAWISFLLKESSSFGRSGNKTPSAPTSPHPQPSPAE